MRAFTNGINSKTNTKADETFDKEIMIKIKRSLIILALITGAMFGENHSTLEGIGTDKIKEKVKMSMSRYKYLTRVLHKYSTNEKILKNVAFDILICLILENRNITNATFNSEKKVLTISMDANDEMKEQLEKQLIDTYDHCVTFATLNNAVDIQYNISP